MDNGHRANQPNITEKYMRNVFQIHNKILFCLPKKDKQ